MVQRFLAAVEHVVAVAPPRALLYLAIDGVASVLWLRVCPTKHFQ